MQAVVFAAWLALWMPAGMLAGWCVGDIAAGFLVGLVGFLLQAMLFIEAKKDAAALTMEHDGKNKIRPEARLALDRAKASHG